jgi:hypothetical protein
MLRAGFAPTFAEASEGKQGRLVRAGLIRSERVRVKGKVRLFKVVA